LCVLCHSALRRVGRMLVLSDGKSGVVVEIWSVDARLISREDPCLIEGRMSYDVLVLKR